ncbi:MAG: PQQ-binding-like beta-propeller repeat protein [Armatimonadetes bacterium]|nr:PQQ-binding-like beta-propeller repeat protein [Armatimonadota bacterium]
MVKASFVKPVKMFLVATLVVCSASAIAQLANSPWPMFRHDLRHTGASPSHDPAPGGTYWKYSVGGGLSSPAIGPDGTIYIGGSSSLYALNSNGTFKWSASIGSSTRSSPAIASDGTIYIGSNSDRLYAFNSNGTLKWSYLTGGDITGSPAVAPDGTIYIGSRDGKLYALNPNGTRKWSCTLGDMHMSSPAVGPDGKIYVGSSNSKLYAVNPTNGSILWNYSAGDGILSSPAISSDGSKIFFGAYDGYCYAINASDGSLIWKFLAGYKNGSTTSSPAIGPNGTVYVGSNYGTLYALDPATGAEIWHFETGSDIRSSPAVTADGTIIFSTFDGYVWALNSNGTKKWHFLMRGSGYSSPAIAADGSVVIGSFDGYVYGNLRGTPPAANPPSNLVATALSETQVHLQWQDNSNDEYGFRIERKIAGGAYTFIANVGESVTTYTDSGLSSGQTYYYRVCAYQEAGNSAYSNEALVTTPGLAAPTDLVATPISETRVDLTWTDRSLDELGFRIERMVGPNGLFQQIAIVNAGVTTYSDVSVNPATNYYYRVRAFDATRVSTPSNEDWALTPGKDFTEVSIGNTSRHQMALTFDAGTASIRSGLIQFLKDQKVFCTFFITGLVAQTQPSQVAQIAANGNHIGNHTYDHPDLRDCTDEQIAWQLSVTDDILYGITGHHTHSYFRAPYGYTDSHVLAAAANAGFRSIYWTEDCGDASWNASTEEIINRTLNAATNGCIMLYHCTVANTEAAMPTIINELRNRGYELVTVPEIIAPEEVVSPVGTINPGWNLISIPLEPANPSPHIVFRNQDIDSKLFRWDKDTATWVVYSSWDPEAFGNISADEGYFYFATEPTTIKCMGAQPTVARHIKLAQAAPLESPWTIIGYPWTTSQDISNCEVFNPNAVEPKTRSIEEAISEGWISATLWWWDSATCSLKTAGLPDDWPDSTKFEPWRGYWLQSHGNCLELIIPPP